MTGEEEMLTIVAAARELGVHRDTVYDWIRKGRLKAVERPAVERARWRIPRSEIERLRAGA
jgi:excisionase family DNA binding protein